MTEKVFYASDIEYQQLEDDVMGTTFDVLPYHPAYAKPQDAYNPHWLAPRGLSDYYNQHYDNVIIGTDGSPYGYTIVGDDDTTAGLVDEVDHDTTIGKVDIASPRSEGQGYIPGLREIYYK